LSRINLDESEIVVVDDCSREALDWDTADGRIRVVKLEPYECYKLEGNYNNPAKAFNAGLEAARGERIAILSSDVLVPARVLNTARIIYDGSFVYCPMVIDLETSMEYCGPHRVFPMPWFLYMSKEAAINAGGWDENYLLGLCYEDNDFIGRLALETKKFVFDWNSIVWHQSHYQPAYQNGEWVQQANKRNEDLTRDKWGVVPFGGLDQVAFQIRKTRHEQTGNVAWEFEDIRSLKDEVIAKTNSPFVKVAK
jgi:hypothetical protein